MVARVQLTPAEREIVEAIMHEGWHTKLDNWTIGRLALARSLQIPEMPDKDVYSPVSSQKGGIELHSLQLTGEGRPDANEDFTDIYRALISMYEGVDLFGDEVAFHEALQRHVRRGLATIEAEWKLSGDLNQYILNEVYAERLEGDDTAEGQGADLGERVGKVLGQIGIGATLLDALDGPRLTRFMFELHQLDDLDRLRRGTGKIAFALGLGDRTVAISLGVGERRVQLEIPRTQPSWKIVDWQDVRPALESDASAEMEMPVCLGTDVLGQPYVIDLAEAPHLFVGGTTGSGKSMCLHSILLSLIHDRERWPELLLIDPKAVEFAAYKGLPNLIGGAPVTTAESAVVALENLVEEMERRQIDLKSAGEARNITEANARGANMRRIVAVVDELGDLFMTRRDIEIPLIRLAQKARSVGIHLVLATQRPEAATFPGMLRSNIPSRIALTVQKAAESRIILDEGGAEDLLMRGDMLVRFAGKTTVRAHGCRVQPADITQAVRRQ